MKHTFFWRSLLTLGAAMIAGLAGCPSKNRGESIKLSNECVKAYGQKQYETAIERLGGSGIEAGRSGLRLTYPCFCTRSELHAASAPHASDGTYVYAGTCRGLSRDEVEHKADTRGAQVTRQRGQLLQQAPLV